MAVAQHSSGLVGGRDGWRPHAGEQGRRSKGPWLLPDPRARGQVPAGDETANSASVVAQRQIASYLRRPSRIPRLRSTAPFHHASTVSTGHRRRAVRSDAARRRNAPQQHPPRCLRLTRSRARLRRLLRGAHRPQ